MSKQDSKTFKGHHLGLWDSLINIFFLPLLTFFLQKLVNRLKVIVASFLNTHFFFEPRLKMASLSLLIYWKRYINEPLNNNQSIILIPLLFNMLVIDLL